MSHPVMRRGLSAKFSYRLPGVAAEWWPYKRGEMWAGGCENYGWGATFPTLLIRNIIGFRETSDLNRNSFYLAPALSDSMFEQGKIYGISNLSYRGTKIDVNYRINTEDKIEIELKCKSDNRIKLLVKDDNQRVVAKSETYSKSTEVIFSGYNYGLYTVFID